jgi:hypothetical protein
VPLVVPEERGRSAIAERQIPVEGERLIFDCWRCKRKEATGRRQSETGEPWFSRTIVDEIDSGQLIVLDAVNGVSVVCWLFCSALEITRDPTVE